MLIELALFIAQKASARGDVAYATGCCFRSVACMNQILFALNEEYLLNEKGAVAVADGFALCPQNYQQQVESVFALLTVDAKSIIDAVKILDEIEQGLSQWYGDLS